MILRNVEVFRRAFGDTRGGSALLNSGAQVTPRQGERHGGTAKLDTSSWTTWSRDRLPPAPDTEKRRGTAIPSHFPRLS